MSDSGQVQHTMRELPSAAHSKSVILEHRVHRPLGVQLCAARVTDLGCRILDL